MNFRKPGGSAWLGEKLLVSIPTLQSQFSTRTPDHKSALNALVLTCQAFPWMSFHRHTLLGLQVIGFDEGTSKRGVLVDIGGRSVGLDTSDPASSLSLEKPRWKSLKRFLINANWFFFQQSKALVSIPFPLRLVESEVSLHNFSFR